MNITYTIRIFFSLLLGLGLIACQPSLPDEIALAYEDLPDRVEFNFHIRPILSDRCYACHGPDEETREAGLRLDQEASAFARLAESDGHALVKGRATKSMAWQRIMSEDPDLQMPPPSSNLSLSVEEKALITKWIEQGAEWKKHWAFIPPEQVEPPDGAEGWARNPIDQFVFAQAQAEGLSVSQEADKERLIRRLSFDVRGLPPSLDEMDAFMADDSPNAYENLVDRLLQTDAHAERMAMDWLDVARFADSHGLHADGMRSQWPWRDWLIEAFKKNLSYKDFVSWQLAGDMMPNARREQILATGFHRNHTANSESGIVSEEFRLQYVSDRTNTTATAFLGLTMECATCHDHKFDPISQKEYYQMSAFFNQVPELGMLGNDKNFGPLLPLPEPETERQIDSLSNAIATLEKRIELSHSEVSAIDTYVKKIENEGVDIPDPDGFFPFDQLITRKDKKGKVTKILDRNSKSTVRGNVELVAGKVGKGLRLDSDFDNVYLREVGGFDIHEPFSAGGWIQTDTVGSFQAFIGNIGDKNSGWRGWIFFLDSLNRPALKVVHSHSHNYLHVRATQSVQAGEWTHVFFTYDGSAKAKGLRIYLNGKEIENNILHDHLYKNIRPVRTRSYKPDPKRGIRMGQAHNYLFTDTDNGVLEGNVDQIWVDHQAWSALEVAALYQKEAKKIHGAHPSPAAYVEHYLFREDQIYQARQDSVKQLRAAKYRLMDEVQEVMVLEEMTVPRSTHILVRGQYDVLGEEVFAATPEALPSFSEEFPKNRLGLAQWLFQDNHPLTARVAVNRYWQMIFGEGLVSTPHDFGSQGALPTHPDLLDWLAVEFETSGWNTRELLTLMLCSATYRQSSISTEAHMRLDPNNVYLARGASYRLPAEMIRDNALAASGLLSPVIGGRSVKPYQPAGLWKEKNEFSGFLLHYIPDSSDNLYRRSMYTFIRRTSPPPAMTILDMPDRASCMIKRERTNTPLQALVILNDPQFVEASRVLAVRMQREAGTSWEKQVNHGFRLLCGRQASEQELIALRGQYQIALESYQQDLEAATELLSIGEAPMDEELDVAETAAMTLLASTIMNFDESYMKR